MINYFNSKYIEILRCIADLKYGIPIFLEDKGQRILVFPVERINKEVFEYAKSTFEEVYLIISQQRAKYLKFKNCKIICKDITFNNIEDIVFKVGFNNKNQYNFDKEATIDNKAVEIMKLSELIPAALVIKLDCDDKFNFKMNSLKVDCIENYINFLSDDLYEISSADLKLKDGYGEIKCFRSQFSKDHYAIIIYPKGSKKLKSIPTVRVHSSCFTGDLLNSIKCDCHDQLHNAIKVMGKDDGGIIVYLNQEGRGIGLTNKIRVYRVQSKGYDTVEANMNLGLDDDARAFQIAARILKKLKVKKINLLSNNPAKARDLKNNEILVEKIISHQFFNSEIKEYYKSKVKKFKHSIEI
ncbi:GTP cyclohydrolase II [Rickettsiales endosymbiont of Trichoplax sp. H2]|uniref:GTP cyclohydrolase II n=1 Tax=Rickettsiales endosymbiont of Trichoplax sp. H2 TaxID=2021221 RepID=UPI0012B3CEB5|nr:GTP cyclohydrolase II [Rickettsiales endosymbiont of Trichoplax sp. H2]MSO14132.1 GTP cyclohydrolase-2 [Rickettsiales endosymbiont of Trichoplax sp. H2]